MNTSALSPVSLDIETLQQAYRSARLTPSQVVERVCEAIGDDAHHAWVHRIAPDQLRQRARELEQLDPASLPLWGVPFAIKDNIDLAGVPTTAGCPAFAYTPERSAFVVQRLLDAGAIAVGKTNLDQFATGLNGTRSPYGACLNAFDRRHVSGGSSSGSAVAVALGQVSFSLGTDTAGSGRVPAAFNHLVGLKPTCGLLSTRGVVPACRSLDTVSIFALTAADAQQVYAQALGQDAEDGYSRPAQPHGFDFGSGRPWTVGIPRPGQLEFFGDTAYATLFADAVERARALGAHIVDVDFEPFFKTARLLYQGPWVAERYQAIRDFIDRQPDAVFPVTREITLGGAKLLAADAFAAQYRLRELQARCEPVWRQVDVLLTPTAGTLPTLEQMWAEPVARNSDLGLYTNFMNLLDLAAIALPAGFRPDGLPFGVTFAAPAHQDQPLLNLGRRWQASAEGAQTRLGATAHRLPAKVHTTLPAVPSGQVQVAVCGAHLQGQPLHHQLTTRGARLVERTTTAACYRFYALAGGPPQRPGLVRVDRGGAAIEVEVWELPASAFGSFVAGIPAPLGIGRTVLADGRSVAGFICEPAGVVGATDITAYGGWRAWLQSQAA
ncbi:allophanate hydrolase [Caldimonas brevitalea]|uniref:Allophanate hydrolase n=1 Tax=Caldimonas brevitalea TaxID=413882 RepID=A0A0G3BR06_9BURK|nr:allophanate hydrolase [Caldimonas brevitalea]AKJ29776.1 allophanate hydrolase [Caldimonas brevitalea]